MDLKEIDILGPDIDKHWYYFSKARAMMNFIEPSMPFKVLDVGAGSGFFSRYLLNHSAATEAWCVDISYEKDLDSIEMGKQVHYRRSIESIDVDLVLLMDVLEHVNDDISLLQEYIKKVPRGCKFFISVPAFQFLWSGHDDFLDHKRRYTLQQLEKVAVSSGLKLKCAAYFFGMVLPIVIITRMAHKLFFKSDSSAKSQLVHHHPFVNGTLKVLCAPELSIMRFNRYAGLTVFCLAESL